MKSLFCFKCGRDKNVRIVSKREKYEVKGETFSILARFYVCAGCGSEIFEKELDKENLELLYGKYRKTHGLLTSGQIKDIRKKYSLSQRAMTHLLEWGEVTLSRYENGSIQDPVHNEVLGFIQKPENMLEIYKKNKHLLAPKDREKLGSKLDELLKDTKKGVGLISLFESLLSEDESANEYTGFKKFNLQKTKNLILYIAENSNGILKTKVNKLLFYIDFLFFKKFTISITGNKYVRLQFGPIPDNYDDIINLMVREDLLEKHEVIFNRNKSIVGEELAAKFPADKEAFNEDEIKIIDFCIEKFKKFNCGQISEYSHREKPYKETEEKALISYRLAKDLSLSTD